MIFQNSTDLLVAAAESARMQQEHGIKEPVFKSRIGQESIAIIRMYNLQPDRTFPVGVVEGRPVFVDDIVYGKGDRCAYTVTDAWKGNALWESFTMAKPKPETVMVELLREDAEWIYSVWGSDDLLICTSRVSAACKVALEK